MVDRRYFPEEGCACSTFGDERKFGAGFHLLHPTNHGYEVIKRRNPWLELYRCTTCGAYWYVAFDTVEGDFYFVRMNEKQVQDIIERDDWPTRFDNFANVWPPK